MAQDESPEAADAAERAGISEAERHERLDKVILNGLSHCDAAAVLDLPVGTVKSRMIAAKQELLALAKRLLPPSQRGPL